MAARDSSPRRRTARAGSPNRSTTSSTTAPRTKPGAKTRAAKENRTTPDPRATTEPRADDAPRDASESTAIDAPRCAPDPAPPPAPPSVPDPPAPPDRLAPNDRLALLALLQRGASPAGACAQLGLPLALYLRTYESDPEFRSASDAIPPILHRNVAAALYRAALEGNVSAQTAWLRMWRPAGWDAPAANAGPDPRGPALLDDLSDDELRQLARVLDVPLPAEPPSEAPDPCGAPESRRLPA